MQSSADGENLTERSALRIQAAAVAAQQAALDEEEARLRQRQGALEQQQDQLASHLEEKRKRLLALQEHIQAERRALHGDRSAYEAYVAQVTGDLGQAQREVLEQQEAMQTERRRLNALVRRFKKRTQRTLQAERNRVALREEELANEECNLAKEREALEQGHAELAEDRLQWNAEYELGRRRLRDAWQRLRQAQQAWRRRRRLERAALKLRGQELENAEFAFREAQDALARDQQAWENRRLDLERDIEGLRRRFNNQRLKLVEQQQLASEASASRDLATGTSLMLVPATNAMPALSAPADANVKERLALLERLAGDLADQRLELAEQWQRLLETQARCTDDQARATAEIEALLERMDRQEQSDQAHEHRRADLEAALEHRRRELAALHQQLIGWRARLHAREHSWESERTRLLANLGRREELAESQLDGLVELRQRWVERRQQEIQRLHAEREGYERLRQELATLRQDVEERSATLEDERRKLAEKALALEQLRQEVLVRTDDSAAGERRLQRLRRRWLTQQAEALRAVKRGRQALQAELAAISARSADLERRAAEVARADAELTDKLTAWEHKQILASTRHTRLQQALQTAHAERACLERELSKMRDEIERVARALLDEGDPPTLQIERAA